MKVKSILSDRRRFRLSRVRRSLQIGEYVFASKYSDGDLNDPWQVGFITEIGIDNKGNFIRVNNWRKFRNYTKISDKEGSEIINIGANYA